MKEGKTTKRRRSYDAEFKANILQLHENGRSVKSLSESFGINENVLYRWKKESSASSFSKKLTLREGLKQVRKQLNE